jgi:hypothetical protein
MLTELQGLNDKETGEKPRLIKDAREDTALKYVTSSTKGFCGAKILNLSAVEKKTIKKEEEFVSILILKNHVICYLYLL